MALQLAFSAGALEKFCYCPLTWWLSRGGAEEEEEALAAGERKHEVVVEELKGIESHEIKAHQHEIAILYFAIAATIVAILGVTFRQRIPIDISEIFDVLALIWLLAACYFLYEAETTATKDQKLVAERVVLIFAMTATLLAVYSVSYSFIGNELLSQVTEVAALLWLIGASFFLYHALRASIVARVLREKYSLVDKTLSYVDDQKSNAKLYVSHKYGLRGRPDYVITQGDFQIPVEVKTGRTPRGPLFSHIVQLSAYCLLVEEDTGRAPPHGILRYERMEHEIEYGADQRNLVLGKLAEMHSALEKGEAHRNHNRPGKCVGCSRRTECPEKLA
jgi:CRISPR-associated exonuclease Cas4